MINNQIEDYLDGKYPNNYVYFVYSLVTKKIYVGETSSFKRIEIYLQLINEKESIKKISSYNYYTKKNTINYELAGDIVDSNNKFEVVYFETKHNKYLEKLYINYLKSQNYSLYNKIKYKKHLIDIQAIDFDIINKLPQKFPYKNPLR